MRQTRQELLSRLAEAQTRASELEAERKQVEKALCASEVEKRTILQSPMNGYCLVNMDGHLQEVNDAYCQMLGYSRDELLTMTVADVEVAETPEETARHFEFIRTNGWDCFETRQRRKDGQIIDIEVSVAFIPEVNRLSVLQRDITGHKQTEAALRESEARFRSLIEQAPIAITISRNRVLIYANSAYVEMHGFEHCEEMIGMPVIERVAPESRPASVARARSREQGLPVETHYEYVGLRKDGTAFPVVADVVRVDLADGPANLGFFQDITERKRAEEMLRERDRLQIALDKEKELNELKSRFVSLVSHEFRTPLAIIQLNNGLLQHYDGKLTSEQRAERLENILAQTHQMTKLLDEVLTISRIESKKLTFNPAPLDVTRFCQDMIDMIRESAESRDFTCTVTDDCGTRLMDAQLLQHILLNLLTNAVKYSPAGSMVYLEARCQPDKVVFKVRDEGIGIPPEDQLRLFEAFYRAANAVHIQGTGLGLTIVKQMVERHGGIITLESAVGIGTTFTVVIPAHTLHDSAD